jgi:S1-C subfamily serine protease
VVAARSVENPLVETLGLLPGDVIFLMNQTPITSLPELRSAVQSLQQGDTVIFHIERQRELMYVPIQIQLN